MSEETMTLTYEQLRGRKFKLYEYYESIVGTTRKTSLHAGLIKDKNYRFKTLCNDVFESFKREVQELGESLESETYLEHQRNAIIGIEADVRYFMDKINAYLKQNNVQNEWFPSWYKSLPEAIFHENWGLGGIAEWMYSEDKDLRESSSAKIIGNNIFFLINGETKLMPQQMSNEARGRIRRALRLNDPNKRPNYYEEIFTQNDVRVAIYADDITVPGQEVIVFRKYVVPKLTFEEQASRGTIPQEAVPLFKQMVKIGFNVVFAGPVRTAKTTFLQTWQMYESDKLEGVVIQSDPELKFYKLKPKAPIMTIIADKSKLKTIVENMLRGDADYYVFAEARDGLSLYVALDIATRGQNRMKMTYHINHRKIKNICYDIARRIVDEVGGNLYSTVLDVAQTFNYVFEMKQLSNKGQKRLAGIYEIRLNDQNGIVEVHTICKYHPDKDNWTWNYTFGTDKEEMGMENPRAFENFKEILHDLAEANPMAEEDKLLVIDYSHLKGGK